jgi:hypothetical protein
LPIRAAIDMTRSPRASPSAISILSSWLKYRVLIGVSTA